MAESRTFNLIGNFEDNITKNLASVQKSLDSIKTTLNSIHQATAPLKTDFKELASNSKDFNDSLREQTSSIKASISALRSYRTEVAKVQRAQSKLKFNPPPYGGGGGRGGYGGYGGGRGGGYSGGIARDSSYVFSQVLGNQIAGLMTNAIVSGFQMGVGLMMKPFQYFQSALQERIADQQSDIKAAGGYFSIAQRQTSDKKFIRTFQEAMEYTQMNNKYMSQLAKSLPGNNQQYIEVSKRLSDSIARIVVADPRKAIEYANKLRSDPGRIGGITGAITGTGPKAIRQAMTEIAGDITSKTVLAGLGGGAQGGVAGAYGLPGLTERMLTQQTVSMGQFRRYAAIFRDPMVSDALERYIPLINKTAATTTERMEVVRKMFNDILPPEVVRAFIRSTAGVIEGLRATIFDPETGLFGLGRKMKNLGPKFDDYGKIVEESIELGIFDLLGDTFGNLMLSLQPLVDIIPQVFDPINAVAKTLSGMRISSANFLRSFELYKKGLTDYTKGITDTKLREKFGGGGKLEARASFAAINNFFRGAGVYGQGPKALETFKKNADKIMSMSLDPGAMLKEFASLFMGSEVSKDMGKQIGIVIRTVLQQISNILNQIMGVAKESKFIEGLKEGFGEEGKAAFVNIVRKVFEGLGSLLLTVVKTFPLETALLASVSLLMPALAAGLSNVIGIKIERFIDQGLPRLLDKSKGFGAAVLAKSSKQRVYPSHSPSSVVPMSSVAFRAMGPRRRVNPQFPNTAIGMYPSIGGVTGPYTSPGLRGKITPMARTKFGALSSLKAKGVATIAPAIVALSTHSPALAKAGKSLLTIGKGIPLLGTALTLLDFGMRKMGGEGTAKAAGGAIGSGVGGVLGGIVGTAIPIPGGTVIGGIIGSMMGGWLGENVAPVFNQILSYLKVQWGRFSSWFSTLPETLGGWLGATFVKIRNWALYELPLIGSITLENLKKGVSSFLTNSKKTLTDGKTWSSLGNALVNGLKYAFTMSLPNVFSWLIDFVKRGLTAAKTGAMAEEAVGTPKEGDKKFIPGTGSYTFRKGKWVKNAFGGSLGDAISSELKHKPPGSNLVIANSSETVIPAAGGYGMVAFVQTLQYGFSAVVGVQSQAIKDQKVLLEKVNQTLKTNQQQTNLKLSLLEQKFTTPSMPGGLGGAAAGGVDAFTPLAQRFGLTMTSAYRPGDPGWHGANRARDFSNGTGPTSQMMQFAQYMASTYGANLKELIYTPLGFSIKNGRRVAPYAQGGHYNHVHVAYGLGPNYPAFFTNRQDAVRWERSMMPGGARVASVTTNSSEGFGTTIHAPITIHQQPGQDAEEVATIVVSRLGMAVQTVLNHM